MKGYKAKPAKEKIHETKSGGNQAQTSKSPLPVESHGMSLTPLATNRDNTCKMLSVRMLIRDSVPRAFIGGSASQAFSLPGMYQNSHLSEGKQVFSTNCIVCTNSLGAVSHSYPFCE